MQCSVMQQEVLGIVQHIQGRVLFVVRWVNLLYYLHMQCTM